MIIFLLISLLSFSEVKFGPEWTFTNEKILNACPDRRIIDCPELIEETYRMSQAFKESCQLSTFSTNISCDVNIIDNDDEDMIFQINFRNKEGKIISTTTVHNDPRVIEVNTTPLTMNDLNNSDIKAVYNFIFKTMEKEGLRADQNQGIGGGHIHFDYTMFEKPRFCKFLKFIALVDSFPHFFGAGTKNCYNPKRNDPLSMMFRNSSEPLSGTVSPQELTLEKAIKRCQTNPSPYSDSYTFINDLLYKGKDPKYQAVNFQKLSLTSKFNTIEFRALSPQKSYEKWVQQAKIFKDIIDFVNINPIKYNPNRFVLLNCDEKALNMRIDKEMQDLAFLLGKRKEDLLPLLYKELPDEKKTSLMDKCKKGIKKFFGPIQDLFKKISP